MQLDKRIAFITEDRKSEGLVLDFSIRENLALPNLEKSFKGKYSKQRARTTVYRGYDEAS